MTAALRIRNLSKTFPGQRALDSVDMEIASGEIHALVGQNGSGKSTIVKILAGYHEPDRGALAEVADVPFELGSAPAAAAAGLRFVHQDLGLVESMTVSDNFRMSRRLRALSPLRRNDDRRDAVAALAALGYDIDPTRTIAELAESERTAVGVARALDGAGEDGRFPLLVLDEATAALPGPEVERLFGALRRVAAAGTAVLFISHYLDEVLAIADRVTVLRDGRRVATETTRRADPREPRQPHARPRAGRRGRRPHPPRAAGRRRPAGAVGRAASAEPSWRRSTSRCAAARSSASPV